MYDADLFKQYEQLVAKADQAFQKMGQEYGSCIECKRQCSDCCNAIFGLFLIEIAFIQHHFSQLDRTVRQEVIVRADKADEDLKKIEEKLQAYDDDPQIKSYALSKERLRCPLLDMNHACTLYPFRPITCRVYGIPTAIQGTARVCGRAAFKKGESYPTFDLDGAYRALYQLSKDLLAKAGLKNMEQASLLLSVSKAIKTPLKDLMQDSFE